MGWKDFGAGFVNPPDSVALQAQSMVFCIPTGFFAPN